MESWPLACLQKLASATFGNNYPMSSIFLRGTKWLLLGVILSLPFAQVKAVFLGLPIYISEGFVLAAIFLFVAGVFRKQCTFRGADLVSVWFILFLNLFLLGAWLSFLYNPQTFTGLGMLKSWFAFPLLYAFLWLQVGEEGDRKRILLAWLGALVLTAAASLAYLVLGKVTYDGRLSAWYGSPNYLAIFLSPGVLIAFYLHRISGSFLPRFFFVLSAMFLLFALYQTHSYGVWGALAVAGIFFGLSCKQEGKSRFKATTLTFLAVAMVGGAFFFFEKDTDKWQDLVSFDERSSLASRMMIWRSAERMIEDSPLLGIGIGRFQEVYLEYQQYFPPYLEWAVPQPHSLYLALWLQTGLIGLIGFIGMVTVWFREQWKRVRTASSDERFFRLLCIALLLLYLVYGLTDTPYFKTDLASAFWTVLVLGFFPPLTIRSGTAGASAGR